MDKQKPRKPWLTDSEHFLLKAERYDRYLRSIVSVVLVLVVAFNILNVIRLQQVFRQNEAAAVAAREANRNRQNEIKAYIRCVILLRYDNPNLTPQSPRQDVETALDKCAANSQINK